MKNIQKIIKLLLFFLFQVILFNIRNNKSNFENILNRYIKFNRKNISIIIQDEKLLSIMNYLKSLKEKVPQNIYYTEIKNPRISFISPVFNQVNDLYSFILSIQKQKMKDYELIFVDDFSMDNSVAFIQGKKKEDKRIKLIRNKKNMGTLYSRYMGQKFAKAKHSIFLDCDDLVLEDGIFKSYNHIIKYNLDIVQFHSIWQDKNSINLKYNIYKYNKIIYRPILQYIYYYDYNSHNGIELNYALWDKLVKTEIINKAFNFIGETYVKKNIIIHNDLIILYSLFQMANSYQYINEIGYFYIRNNNNSTINSWKKPQKRHEIINSLFINIQFLYEKTNDTYLDKKFCIYKIQQYFKIYNTLLIKLNNNEYYYIKNIIDKILNLNYISAQDKLMLTKIELFILNMKEI